MVRKGTHNMRSSAELRELLYVVNAKRVLEGKRPLRFPEFTRKIARRYVEHEDLMHEDFIKL